MKVHTWDGCYDKALKGFIVPEAFSHPAKYSLGLIERIFDHCLQQGYLKRGDVVGDCFGGVAIGGLVAAYRGLIWKGVELEPKFIGFSRANINLHRAKLEYLGLPIPEIVQGDSRQFAEKVVAVVSSPPYAVISAGAGGLNTKPAKHDGQQSGRKASAASQDTDQRYGQTEGQIAQLKGGSVEAVVSSPPFRDARSDTTKCVKNTKGGPCADRMHTVQAGTQYGQSEGQIDNLKTGDVSAVVTSPPWEDETQGGCPGSRLKVPPSSGKGHTASLGARERQAQRDEQRVYGTSEGQIGRTHGETYWEAMKQVYTSCFAAIKPGGYIILVVKDYVKGGKRVPLCDDTCRLLEYIGFEMVERIHAMLVKEMRHGDLFNGHTVTTKSRKSFFRRLAEKNGSPRIDFEEVLVAKRL